MKISLIVPFHNTPLSYFKGCLESLRSQNLQECEFILVDDWSTDKSIDLAKRYAQEDNRFRYIRNAVWGHEGGARDYGYQHAKGEYVWFVDADDQLVEPRVLEHLIDLISQYNYPDVALCQGKHVFLHQNHNTLINPNAVLRYLPEHQLILDACRSWDKEITGNSSAYNKIFKKDFLLSINFSCAKQAINADIICAIVIALADTLLSINDVYYLIIDTPGSLTKQDIPRSRYQEVFRLLRHTHQFYLDHKSEYQPIIAYIAVWVIGLSSYNKGLILSWKQNKRAEQKIIEKEYYQFLQEALPHYPVTLTGGRQMIYIKQSIYKNQIFSDKELHRVLYRYFLWQNSKIMIFKIAKKILPISTYTKIRSKIKKY